MPSCLLSPLPCGHLFTPSQQMETRSLDGTAPQLCPRGSVRPPALREASQSPRPLVSRSWARPVPSCPRFRPPFCRAPVLQGPPGEGLAAPCPVSVSELQLPSWACSWPPGFYPPRGPYHPSVPPRSGVLPSPPTCPGPRHLRPVTDAFASGVVDRWPCQSCSPVPVHAESPVGPTRRSQTRSGERVQATGASACYRIPHFR